MRADPSPMQPSGKRAVRGEWRVSKALFAAKRMAYRVRGKRVVHILHVGKTGGSALKAALRPYRLTGQYVIDLHGHGFRLRDAAPGEKVVFFIRDPVARFVSGFYSRKRRGEPRFHVPWSPEEERAFARFETPNELAIALSSGDDETRTAAVDAMKVITHVNSSYWDWFETEEYFGSRLSDILFIGLQERLGEDWEVLKDVLALPRGLELPEDEVKAHRNPLSLDKRLEEVGKRNLREWYARDYEFCELCRSLVAEMRERGWGRSGW